MNAKLKETRNWRDVWRVCTEGDTLEHLFDDDHAMPFKQMRARIRAIIAQPDTHTFRAFWGRSFAGCFVLYHLGSGQSGLYEVHTLLREKFRGLIGVRIGRFAATFGLGLPYVERLVSFCPDCMPQAYLFAKMCGFRMVAEPCSIRWVKNGIDYGVKLVSLSKEDLCLYS